MALLSTAASVSRWMAGVANAITGVVLPAGCRLCEKLLVHSSRLPICDRCLASFRTITAQICPLCGQPLTFAELQDDEFEYCRECQAHRFAFTMARSFGIHQDSLVRAILLMKYERLEPLGEWFAKRLSEMDAPNRVL